MTEKRRKTSREGAGGRIVEAPRCARCGYDLSGDVESWEESCPVAGVCSECGLEFLWADALRTDRQELHWQFEHTKQWWNIRKAWGTVIRALFPWQFWRKVQVRHEVRGKRLVLWLLVCIGSVWIVAGAFGFTATAWTTLASGASVPNFVSLQRSPSLWSGDAFRDRGPITMRAYHPFAWLIDPETIGVWSRGKQVTLPRPPRGDVVVYDDTTIGTIVIGNLEFERTTSKFLTDKWIVLDENGDPIEGHALAVHVVYLTDLNDPNDQMNYVRPWVSMIYDDGEWAPSGHRKYRLPYELFVTLAFLIPALAVMLAAQTEWRQEKAHQAHLWRIATYSFAPALFLLMLEMLVYAWEHVGWVANHYDQTGVGDKMFPWAPPEWLWIAAGGQRLTQTTTAYVTIWLAVYWWFALKRGLRLERSFWLWVFVCVAGAAGALHLYRARQLSMLDIYFDANPPVWL